MNKSRVLQLLYMTLIGAVGSLLATLLITFFSTDLLDPQFLAAGSLILNLILLVALLYYHRAATSLRRLQEKIGFVTMDDNLHEGATPIKCMAQVTTSLKFMGIGGSKWSPQDGQLRDMLGRISRVGGTAKFLLLDPESSATREFSANSGHDEHWLSKRLITSLRAFKDIKSKGVGNLEVRLYNHRPYYRLVLIDDRVAIVGQYRGLDSETGWGAPLVHFEQGSPFSFYLGYHVHFEGEWDKAQTVDWDSL